MQQIVFLAKLFRFAKSFSKCELHDFLVFESKGQKISKANDPPKMNMIFENGTNLDNILI